MKPHDWNSHIAAMISVIGSPQFPEELVRTLRARVAFDYSVMFAYRGDAPPIDLFDDFPANKRRIFVTMYRRDPTCSTRSFWHVRAASIPACTACASSRPTGSTRASISAPTTCRRALPRRSATSSTCRAASRRWCR
ncbi:MAG: hypothetical protein M5U09_07030 [Gammaproteobacteria bacterium]|nr:hypothetical protein [Gammaproteobacteria bacterium]